MNDKYKKLVNCTWCGKQILRPKYLKGRFFCCSDCRSNFLKKETNPEGYIRHQHLSKYNEEHNGERMTDEVRRKLRETRLDTGSGESYRKLYGKHEHRIVAEIILNRDLKPGEVVHHIDGNKRNNHYTNLMIFKNQAEHARWHKEHDRKEGDR